ncbi:MAG: DUF58 domain-containing protein, partial [Demequina sp.]|nr:DUF58 domain-containing protein [Demequina sp.]
MFLSWPSVALMAGAVPLAVVTARPETVWAWLILVLAAVLLDVALTPSPRRLGARRTLEGSVRRLEATTSTVYVANPTGRHVRGLVRDAWQPSAEATGDRHALDLPPGEMRRMRTPLVPSRRGDLHAGP